MLWNEPWHAMFPRACSLSKAGNHKCFFSPSCPHPEIPNNTQQYTNTHDTYYAEGISGFISNHLFSPLFSYPLLAPSLSLLFPSNICSLSHLTLVVSTSLSQYLTPALIQVLELHHFGSLRKVVDTFNITFSLFSSPTTPSHRPLLITRVLLFIHSLPVTRKHHMHPRLFHTASFPLILASIRIVYAHCSAAFSSSLLRPPT